MLNALRTARAAPLRHRGAPNRQLRLRAPSAPRLPSGAPLSTINFSQADTQRVWNSVTPPVTHSNPHQIATPGEPAATISAGAAKGRAGPPETARVMGQAKTGVLFMNMGGPGNPEETGPFLKRLFTDEDIIELGGGTFQNWLGDVVAKRRTPKVQAQYEKIGGSPIRKWTESQAARACALLDEQRPESAPHKPYVAFRYAAPLTEEALRQMQADGVEHAVAFSQFPQWSCTTTGSSMNELWREQKRLGMEGAFKWSIIDRWPLHQGFIEAVTDRVEEALVEQFDEAARSKVAIVFSAHSVPMKVVEKGDQYVPEVCATVKAVMARLSERIAAGKVDGLRRDPMHILAWQSKVGFLPWMVPSTAKVLEQYGKKGGAPKAVLLVPVAFTSDHIETLYEIGMEYAEEAEEHGIEHFGFTQGLNGSDTFVKALANIVHEHLDAGANYSPQYKLRCLGCEKPNCRGIVNPAFERAAKGKSDSYEAKQTESMPAFV